MDKMYVFRVTERHLETIEDICNAYGVQMKVLDKNLDEAGRRIFTIGIYDSWLIASNMYKKFGLDAMRM